MTIKHVKWFNYKNSLSEIYQHFGMVFSFAKIGDTIEQSHPWVKCRDFLHDAVRTALTGKKSSIYGFTYAKGVNPDIHTDKTVLLLSEPNITDPKSFRKILNNGIRLINHYENLIGESLSTIRKVSGEPEGKHKHVWLIEGPKFWITAPYLISLYTLLLRLGPESIKVTAKEETMVKTFGEITSQKRDILTNDIKYLTTVGKYVGSVVRNHKKLTEFNDVGFSKLYYEDISISSFHNYTGILSLCDMKTWSEQLNLKVKEEIIEEKSK